MAFLSACRLVRVSDVTCGQRSRPVQSVWQSVGQRDREGEREREGESRASAERHGDEAESAKASTSGGKLKQLAFLKKKKQPKNNKAKKQTKSGHSGGKI